MKKILLVDDDVDLLDSTASLIEVMGYNPIKASDGFSAVEKYEKFRPDLVLMDVKMPKMDGYETFFEIKERFNEAKVIFMTGFADFSKWQKAKSQCAIYMIEKPFSAEFLSELIRRHIKEKNPC